MQMSAKTNEMTYCVCAAKLDEGCRLWEQSEGVVSDDNSSIQSSPWQRDHCWKQANPRPNISKELSLYYFRPLKARGHLTHDRRSWCRRKRRRPYDSHLPLEIKSKPQAQKTTTVENGNAKKDDSDHKEAQSATGQEDGETTENLRDKCNGTTPMDTSEETTAAGENNVKKRKGTKQDGPMVEDDDHKQSNGHHPPANGGTHCRPSRCKRPEGKDLASIIKTLVEHQQTKSINAPGASAGAVPAPVSRPFSSYSITSLLGHNTSSSGETSSSANFSPSDAMQRKTDVSVASVTSTASHHLYHHPQHPLSPHHQYQGSLYLGKEPLAVGSKSPIMAESINHAHYQGQLGSTRNGSPQHYSRASPLNFGRGTQLSPPPPLGSQHHNRTAGTSSSPRASPSSGGGGVTTSHASTPTSAMASLTTGTSPGSTIRTVPKKTAALRQPFSGGHSPSSSSPSRERSNSNASSSSHKKDLHPEGSDSVDGASLNHYGTTPSSPAGVIRPNTVIASPTAHHPVPNAFYPLYQAAQLGAPSSSSLMNAAAVAAATSSVPFHPATLTYYQQMYTAATMAAYRTPLWMHYPGLPGVAPHGPPHMIQPHHQAPPPSSVAPNISSADRRLIDRSPPSPPPPPPQPASGSSITDPAESQRLQHSILATPSSTAALNYSVTALSSSSRDIINGGSAFTSPSGSSWPTDAVGYQHHPDHSARSTAAVSGIASATAKDETSNDVPLNLSKH
uniref:Uncharacterized protein n=1 Tax=Anopheles coluzzii TaxID=1518534 RepID=A0A8W7Q0P8_ANOCL